MAANVVDILVRDRDDAGPDLDALKARLAELGQTVETARANVDDAAAAAALDKLKAQLIEIGNRTANPKIKLSGALRAEAQVHALEAQLGKLGVQEDTAAGSTGRLAGVFAGLRQSLIPAVGQMGLGAKLMMGLNVATTFAEPLVAGLTVTTMGLASSLGAAAGGLGIFAAVAKGAYAQVSSQVAAYTAAQQAAQTATTAAARSTALAQMRNAFNGLSGSQKDFARSIIAAKNEWGNFVSQATPGIDRLVHQGLGLLPRLLSDIRPVLGPVEGALHGIVGDLGRSLQSGGLKTMFEWIAKNAPSAITGLAHAVGNIGAGIGGMLRAFTPASHDVMHGLDDLTARFARWGTTLGSHSGFQSLMSMFKSETPLAVHALGQLGGIIKTVVADMTGLDGVGNSKTLLQLANPVLALANALLKANPSLVRIVLYALAARSAFSKLKPAIDGVTSVFGGIKTGAQAMASLKAGFTDATQAASEATGIWGTLGGKLSVVTSMIREQGLASTIAAGATKVWTGIQAAFDAVMDANPIVLVVVAIAALVAAVILAYKHFAAFRDFVKTAMHDVLSVVSSVVDWIRGHWPLLLAILTGPIGMATLFIVDHWHQIVDGAGRMISDVISFFERLPGMILHALGDLGRLLWNAGVSVVRGLINGMLSMGGSLLSTGEHLAGDIVSSVGRFLGIGSPSRLMHRFGQWFWRGFINGGESMRGALAAHLASMTRAVVPSLSGLPGGGGTGGLAAAGGTVRLQIDLTGGDGEFLNWLKGRIRVHGGGGTNSVQVALGQTW